MSSPTLEERIQHLEDIEALRRLKARYAAYCDEDYNHRNRSTITFTVS